MPKPLGAAVGGYIHNACDAADGGVVKRAEVGSADAAREKILLCLRSAPQINGDIKECLTARRNPTFIPLFKPHSARIALARDASTRPG